MTYYSNSILSKGIRSRDIFNPNNKEHIEAYKQFLLESRWKNGCPFFLEFPFLTIPHMIQDKIVRNVLGIE